MRLSRRRLSRNRTWNGRFTTISWLLVGSIIHSLRIYNIHASLEDHFLSAVDCTTDPEVSSTMRWSAAKKLNLVVGDSNAQESLRDACESGKAMAEKIKSTARQAAVCCRACSSSIINRSRYESAECIPAVTTTTAAPLSSVSNVFSSDSS